MWPFHQPNKNTEVVNTITHLTVDRLAIVEIQFREAEKKFNAAWTNLEKYRATHRQGQPFTLAGKLFVPINPKPDHQLEILEHEKWRAESRRNELLAERAELRKSVGLTR